MVVAMVASTDTSAGSCASGGVVPSASASSSGRVVSTAGACAGVVTLVVALIVLLLPVGLCAWHIAGCLLTWNSSQTAWSRAEQETSRPCSTMTLETIISSNNNHQTAQTMRTANAMRSKPQLWIKPATLLQSMHWQICCRSGLYQQQLMVLTSERMTKARTARQMSSELLCMTEHMFQNSRSAENSSSRDRLLNKMLNHQIPHLWSCRLCRSCCSQIQCHFRCSLSQCRC